jgi:transposase-like protein
MVVPGRTKLRGEVEVDETFIGGVRAGKRGRGAAGKTLVLIAAEVRGRAIGRTRLKVIDDAKAPTLMDAVDDLIDKDSVVVTDGWSGYIGLHERGYKHTVSRASSQVGRNLLPKAHRVASLLKRWLLGTLQGSVGRDRLQLYLDEFVFRFNRRTSRSRGLLFYRLLQQCLLHPPIKANRL